MKRAATETILGSVVEKPLLRLHAASSIEPFWIAVQRVIEAVLPGSLVGLTLQHHPISPFIAKWSQPILDGSRLFVSGYASPDNEAGNIRPVPSFEEGLAAEDTNRDGFVARDEARDEITSKPRCMSSR